MCKDETCERGSEKWRDTRGCAGAVGGSPKACRQRSGNVAGYLTSFHSSCPLEKSDSPSADTDEL